MKTIFCSVVLAVSMLGCTSGPKEKPDSEPVSNVSAPLPIEGKRSAPVAIDASLREASAKLTLKFERKGEGVSVDVSGIDGLTLKSEGAVLRDAAITAGEVKSFEVAYARGAGRTNLVISVRGTFDGAPLARVVTFAIGEGPLTQTGTTVILNDGEAFKLMNAQ
ncbi:MAG: hypothetical protein JNM17_16260 [Archangium sp.]|nr:hypothetical protein [Archangium sp.]